MIVLVFESIMSGVWLVLQIHAYCEFHWYFYFLTLVYTSSCIDIDVAHCPCTHELQGQLPIESKLTVFLYVYIYINYRTGSQQYCNFIFTVEFDFALLNCFNRC